MAKDIRFYEVVGEINKKLAEIAEFKYEGKSIWLPG